MKNSVRPAASVLSMAPLLLLLLMTAACLGEIDGKIGRNVTPAALGDGWEIASPASQGFDEGKLDQAYDLFFDPDEYHTAYSLLVIRNGKLVAEGYARDMADRDRLNNIKSATKSITSLVAGIALVEGVIGSLDDKVHSYLSGYYSDSDPRRMAITVRNLLTMQSGIDYENSRNNREMHAELRPASSLRYILEQPMEYEPGTRFHYHDGAPQLVSGIIANASGQSLADYAKRKLFEPLGITDLYWDAYEEDGVTYGAHGLYLKPRDMAKLGQMVLQRGRWNGRQVVPAAWIAESTSLLVDQAYGGSGYYWWIRPGFDAFTANGHGGQYIYIIPGKNMVIVFTANPTTNEPVTSIGFSYFEDIVFHINAAAR